MAPRPERSARELHSDLGPRRGQTELGHASACRDHQVVTVQKVKASCAIGTRGRRGVAALMNWPDEVFVAA